MTKTGWRGWLDGLTRNLAGKRRRRAAGFISAGKRPCRRLELERLEARLVPAFDFLVNATGATAGVTATVNGTTTTFTATATGAHLNVNDVVTALNTGNVVVDSGSTGTEAGDITINSAVTQPAANGAALTFQSGSGTGVVGNIAINATFNSAGGGDHFPLTFLALNNLVLNGRLNPGSGDVTLTATNGAITNQSAGQVAVTTNLNLTANTGIGTSANPLSASVTNVQALDATGGVFLNVSNTNIGFGGNTPGIQVTTLGDIRVLGGALGASNAVIGPGNITLESTLPASLGGSLNITATAPVTSTGGAGTSITLGGGSTTIASAVSDAGGAVSVLADNLTFTGTVSTGAGTGIVTLAPFSSGQAIDLGHNPSLLPNELGLSQTNLNNVTTGVLRIGSASAGSITVTAAITDVGTGWSTLSLIAAPSGTVTQDSGATLTVTNLQAAGLGGVTLNENNVVSKLAGASGGAFSFTDVSSLAVDNVDNGLGLGLGFGIGIMTKGSDISVSVLGAGDLTVNQPITTGGFGAGSGSLGNITLSAQNNVTVNAAVSTVGTGAITVTADSDNDFGGDFTSTAGGTFSTLGGSITIRGGTDAVHGNNATLGGAITTNGGAGSVLVSVANDINVNAAVSVTGDGGITTHADSDANGDGDFTSSASGSLSTLGGAITVTGANATFGGAVAIGGGVGSISLAALNNVNVNAALAVTALGTGGIAVTADSDLNGVGAFTSSAAGAISTRGGAVSIGAGDDATVGGSIFVSGGTGSVTVTSDHSVFVNAAISITGTSGITIAADRKHSGVGGFTSIAGGTLTTGGGPIDITAGADITVGGTVSVTAINGFTLFDGYNITVTGKQNINVNAAFSTVAGGTMTFHADADGAGAGAFTSNAAGALTTAGGNITITAADITLAGTVNATTNPSSIVTLQPSTNAAVIHLGSNNAFGLTDAELAEITAAVLRIGAATNTGGVTVTNAITAHAGYSTLSLQTAAAITQGGPAGFLTALFLALEAGTGIGVASPLLVDVGTLAAANGTSGDIQVFNRNTVNTNNLSVTATAIDGVTGVVNAAGNVVLQTDNGLTLATGAKIQATGTTTLDVGQEATGGSSVLAGTVAGSSVTVNGGGGNNALTVDFANGASLPDGLTFNGGRLGNDTMTLNDAGTAAAHSYTLSAASAVRDALTLAFTNLAGVTVNAGNQSDTFSVTPSATTAFTVNGGLPNPPTSPGDTLNVNLTGVTNPILIKTFSRATGYSGSWAFANRQDVNFTGIESLLPPEASTAVLKTNGELGLFNSLSGQLQMLSRAGTILSVSAVQAGNGATDVFAITSGLEGAQFQDTLWEFSTVSGWSQLSSGSFAQISAATNSAGQGVVFGVLTDGSLYEQDPANGTGLNAGFTPLSPSGTIASVSAVTDSAGNPTVFAVVTVSHNLWKHSAALPGNGWTELSSGNFLQVSGGLNGAGQAVVYGVVNGGSLWEQDPALGIGLDAGFTQLSGTGGAPPTFLSVAAGRPTVAFGIAADHTLWEHTLAGWQELSIGQFAQVSPSQTAAQDIVFATLSDGEFWEYNSGLLPGNPWTPVTSSNQPVVGVASSSTT